MLSNYTPLNPQQQAVAKDQILRIMIDERGPHYLSALEERLQIEHFKLRQIIEDAAPYLELVKVVPGTNNTIQAEVHITDKGRYFLKYQGGFVGQYESRFSNEREVRSKEQNKKFWNNLRIIIEILLLAAATYGAINAKLHDKKEERWEQEKKEMQSDIDRLKKELPE